MKAVWNHTVIAEAAPDDVLQIDGNWYFPPGAIKRQYVTPSPTHTKCFWKGEARYYDITVDGEVNGDGAWYYPAPQPDAVERLEKDFGNYVAFWRGVRIEP